MIPDHDDLILDACLSEMLGGTTPPDLAPRILRAWNSQLASDSLPPLPTLPVLTEIVPEPRRCWPLEIVRYDRPIFAPL